MYDIVNIYFCRSYLANSILATVLKSDDSITVTKNINILRSLKFSNLKSNKKGITLSFAGT